MDLVKTNGTIQYAITKGGGYNDDGEPIPVSDNGWSDPIPCLRKTNTHHNKGSYRDGNFTMASYEVLILSQPFEAVRVKLIDDRGKDLGDFQVQDIQFHDLVGRVKIMV